MFKIKIGDILIVSDGYEKIDLLNRLYKEVKNKRDEFEFTLTRTRSNNQFYIYYVDENPNYQG